MNYYLAPLEGITGYVFRNAYHRYFQPMDKYFAPFLTPRQHKQLKPGEMKDILPEQNRGLQLVPQLLTNNAKDFIWAAGVIEQMGYKEVNLNLGCPSKTVVTKGKGSGFLADTDKLRRFLEQIFEECTVGISIKTRLGLDDAEEFLELLPIFNQYPVSELIIHPRIQTDFYKNKPRYQMFAYALENSKNPVVYNGDLTSAKDLTRLRELFPSVETVMIGRGILYNPGLLGQCAGGLTLHHENLRSFHDQIYDDYRQLLYGERPVLFKMKELWFYLHSLFENSDKYYKKIKKAEKLWIYEEAVNNLFNEQELIV